jgi:DNA-directed RNA polymerase specialized sigma subunit
MNAINKLSSTQRRRIKMYYFDELDLKTIATIEHTSFQMISKSIKQAIKNLKKIYNFLIKKIK